MQGSFVGEKFTMIESAHFYFPYLHVTNALRQDLNNPTRTLADFEAEIVRGKLPSRLPKYHAYMTAQSVRWGAVTWSWNTLRPVLSFSFNNAH